MSAEISKKLYKRRGPEIMYGRIKCLPYLCSLS